jgi:hypothetical protein
MPAIVSHVTADPSAPPRLPTIIASLGFLALMEAVTVLMTFDSGTKPLARVLSPMTFALGVWAGAALGRRGLRRATRRMPSPPGRLRAIASLSALVGMALSRYFIRGHVSQSVMLPLLHFLWAFIGMIFVWLLIGRRRSTATVPLSQADAT